MPLILFLSHTSLPEMAADISLSDLSVYFHAATPLGCVGVIYTRVEEGTVPGQLRLKGELRVPKCDGMSLSSDLPETWDTSQTVRILLIPLFAIPRNT
jgi:hypothetical protein